MKKSTKRSKAFRKAYLTDPWTALHPHAHQLLEEQLRKEEKRAELITDRVTKLLDKIPLSIRPRVHKEIMAASELPHMELAVRYVIESHAWGKPN